jgi:nickel-dependent lactate racemase
MGARMQIPFGHGTMPLEFGEGGVVRVVSPRNTPADLEAIPQSIAHPIEFETLTSFTSDKRKLLVVVNDHTRPTPSKEVFRHLPLKGKDVTTIIASGTHRPPDAKELEQIIGGNVPPYGGKIAIHNSRDKGSLKAMGKTSRGTELSFNQLVFEADGIVVVGSVEPHYFAGYTGGRKFLLPALAGYDSVVKNHSLAVEESSRILALDGNPVHDDFMEALNKFGRFDDIFSIQLVLNDRHQVSYASAGHIVQSFNRAVEFANQIYVPTVPKKADIVISVNTPPLDIDLYQSQKAIENVKLAVKKGGVIILVSSCPEGIGDKHFYEVLTSNANITTTARPFGSHKVVKLRNLLRDVSIFAVTSMDASIPKAIGLTPYHDVQRALDDAVKNQGKDSEVLVVLDSAMTVPQPKTS